MPNELHELARTGNIDRLIELLDSGVDVNAQDGPFGETPLHCAASHGHVAVCKLLIERGARVGSRDILMMTPLHRSAESGHIEVANLLITSCADVNAKAEIGNTPLHVAAGRGQEHATSLLLHRGADINAKDSNGNAPLYWAALEGHLTTCELLLQQGADVNAKNLFGRTALDGAQERGYSEICKLLLERGTDLTYRDRPFSIPEIGDPFVDSCFQIQFQEFKDERDWHEIPEANVIANASNAGKNEDALYLLKEFGHRYPAFWFTYYWYAIIAHRQGHLDEARSFCLNGLQSSKSKFSLCAMLGTIEWENGNLEEAVKWWIRSAVLQLHTNQLSDDEPFLHLSYVAEAFSFNQIAKVLRQIVDKLNPLIKPRLNAESARKLYNASLLLTKESIKSAIEILGKSFFSA